MGKIHHEEFVAIGKKHNIPTLIDAAADVPPVENLWRYTKMGFDLVGFSGGKGLRGPQSAGLLLGRKDLIEAARLNNSPNGDTLCRTNKVNKEEIIGMLVALESLPEGGPRRGLEGLGGSLPAHRRGPRRHSRTCKTEVFVPEIANAVPHLQITWDPRSEGVTSRRDGQEAPRGQAQHRGQPRVGTAVGDRRLDDGARRGRDRRRAHPRILAGHNHVCGWRRSN